MDCIAALGADDAIALYCLDQNHGGLVTTFCGGVEGGVDLLNILTAALYLFHLLVIQRVHHRLELGIAINPMFSLMFARQNRVTLVVAIYAFLHALAQVAIVILIEQSVPARTPDHLDDIPARSFKRCL